MTKPAIILVEPQLGENIGKAARAMLNFSLTDLRLVAPRDGWPNPAAGPSASGADIVLEAAKVFDTAAEAIADCTLVLASTVRPRGMAKPIVTPSEAAREMRVHTDQGNIPAILFGPERAGLNNDDIALADRILTVPVNPDFGSLNLAQAVILTAYEYDRDADETPPVIPGHPEGQAQKSDLLGLIEHMEKCLAERGYFRSAGREDSQRRMLRNLLQNAGFSSQEVQTMRGIVKCLTRAPSDDNV